MLVFGGFLVYLGIGALATLHLWFSFSENKFWATAEARALLEKPGGRALLYAIIWTLSAAFAAGWPIVLVGRIVCMSLLARFHRLNCDAPRLP